MSDVSESLNVCLSFFFFSNATATTEIYTLSLHDALPFFGAHPPVCGDRQPSTGCRQVPGQRARWNYAGTGDRLRRSEEHTSELQSRRDLVCRLLLEKKKIKRPTNNT